MSLSLYNDTDNFVIVHDNGVAHYHNHKTITPHYTTTTTPHHHTTAKVGAPDSESLR